MVGWITQLIWLPATSNLQTSTSASSWLNRLYPKRHPKAHLKKRFQQKHVNQSGFTLIEVLMVVVILGILAAITIPRYGDHLESVKLKTVLLESEAALRLAKHNAQALSQPVAASFNMQGETIVGFDVIVSGSNPVTILESIDIDPSLSVATNISVGQVIFNPTQSITIKTQSGATLSPQNCELEFTGDINATGNIVIFEKSGAIQIFKN